MGMSKDKITDLKNVQLNVTSKTQMQFYNGNVFQYSEWADTRLVGGSSPAAAVAHIVSVVWAGMSDSSQLL